MADKTPPAVSVTFKPNTEFFIEGLAPKTALKISPADGYNRCVVVVPDQDKVVEPGDTFNIVLTVTLKGTLAADPNADGVGFTTPNNNDCFKISVKGDAFTNEQLATALLNSGRPGPPVIVKIGGTP